MRREFSVLAEATSGEAARKNGKSLAPRVGLGEIYRNVHEMFGYEFLGPIKSLLERTFKEKIFAK